MLRYAAFLFCLVAICTSLLGCPGISAPNVVGMTQAAATSAIENLGLTVGTVTTTASLTVPAGQIISQNPAAGSSVSSGATVSFVVSSGSSLSVPSVVGMTQAAATNTLGDAGLSVGTITTTSSWTVPSGQVISQDPASGSIVLIGSSVNLVLSLGSSPAFGWVTILLPDSIWGLALDQTADGGLIMAGGHNSAYDLYVLKLTNTNTLAWDGIYSSMSGDVSPVELWGHEARGIQQTQDGGYVILGGGHTWINGQPDGLPDDSFLLIKTNNTGQITWSKAYAPENPYSLGDTCVNNRAFALQVTSDGGFMAAGSSYVGGNNLASILKTDSAGTVQFMKVVNNNNNEYGQEIVAAQQTADNGYILCGYSADGPTGYMALLIKLDSNGNVVWSKTYQDIVGDRGAEAYAVAQTADGGYVLGGELINSISHFVKGHENAKVSTYGCWLAKVDSNGNQLWFKSYGHDTTLHYPKSIKITPQGDIVAGGSLSAGPMALAKFDSANGDLLWNFSFNAQPNATVNALELTNDGGCVMVGSGISTNTIIAKVTHVFPLK